MEIKIQETYRCDWCKKLYVRKWSCEQHEIKCSKNPENYRACYGCLNAKKRAEWIIFDNPNREDRRLRNLIFCKAKNQFVYPPQTERDKNWHEMEEIGNGDIPNKPMPKKCDIADYDY